MALDTSKLSAQATGAFTVHTYQTNDSKADIDAGGYFTEQYGKILKSGDIIIYASDMDTDTPDMGVALVYNV